MSQPAVSRIVAQHSNTLPVHRLGRSPSWWSAICATKARFHRKPDRTTSRRRQRIMPRTAQCLCGTFSVIVSAEPVMVNVCHCRYCQRRSGVPWTSNAYFPRETVRLNGPNRIYTRTSNAGTRINHHFCPTCGVTVCWTRETGSTRFGIPVGAFHDPSFPAPSVSFWDVRRYEWSPPMENVDHWDTQPPPP
jgi:hypothetical protein